MLKLLIVLLAAASLLVGCSIEKRLHRPGWHVEWNKRYHGSQQANESTGIAASRVSTSSEQATNDTIQQTPVNRSTLAEVTAEEARILPITPHPESVPQHDAMASDQSATQQPEIRSGVKTLPDGNDEHEEPKRFDWATTLAIVVTALALLTLLLTFAGFSGAFVIPGIWLISILLSLLDPIIIGIAAYRKNKYKGQYREFPLAILLFLDLLMILTHLIALIAVLLLLLFLAAIVSTLLLVF